MAGKVPQAELSYKQLLSVMLAWYESLCVLCALCVSVVDDWNVAHRQRHRENKTKTQPELID